MKKVRAFAAITIMVLAACTELGAPVVPEDIVILSASIQDGIVGAAVAERPSVQLFDEFEDPARGVTVTWTVLAGNGTVGSATSVTNSDGVATVSSWTLGTTTGLNRLRASSSGLEVEFQAVGNAGTPVMMQIASGNNQSVFAGQIVPVDPAVRLTDQYGNGVPDVQVTFAVLAGGGHVTGPVQLTNDDGVAAPSTWRVGAESGSNTLRATTQGLTAIQFNATGSTSSRCFVATSYTVPSTVVGALTPDDCVLPNEFYHDFFRVTLPTTQIVRFDMQSTIFDAYFLVSTTAGNLVADDDDGAAQGSTNSRLTLVGVGALDLAASSAFPFEEGSYSVTSTLLGSLNAQCGEIVYVMRGIILPQTLGGNDCVLGGGPYFYDEFQIYLEEGASITVLMNSTAVDAYLEILNVGGSVPIAENNDISGTNFDARLTFTAPATAYYVISPSSFFPNEVGPYTLTITAGIGGDAAGLSAAPDGEPFSWLLNRLPRGKSAIRR